MKKKMFHYKTHSENLIKYLEFKNGSKTVVPSFQVEDCSSLLRVDRL